MTPEAIDINETAQINRVHRSKRIGFCLFFPLSFFEIYCTIWVNQDYSRNFGDDLIKSCGLISLLKQGCSKPVTQGYAPMAFETPQMIEKPTTSLENLGQCSVTYTVEKCFLLLRGNLLCLCWLPLVLSLSMTGKSPTPSFWHHPLRCL